MVTKKVINQKFLCTNMLIFSKKLDLYFTKYTPKKALENIYHFQDQWFLESIDIARILTRNKIAKFYNGDLSFLMMIFSPSL